MITTQYVDTVTDIAERLKLVLAAICIEPGGQSMTEFLDEQTKDFIREHSWPFSDKLDNELKGAFIPRADPELQNRHARYVVDDIIQVWIPVQEMVFNASRAIGRNIKYETDEDGSIKSVTWSSPTEEYYENYMSNSKEVVVPLINAFNLCLKVAINRISQFAPKVYEEYREALDRSIDEGEPKSSIADQLPKPIETGVKLKLKCSPAIAGYIMAELHRAGYIDVPTKNAEVNYAEWGRLCAQLFQLPDKYKTNAEGWRNVLNIDSGSKNQLPDYKRAKIRLPDLQDLE